MILALFDFDGTVTKEDSFVDFLRFVVKPQQLWLGFASITPLLALYHLRLGSITLVKQRLISTFFKGWTDLEFKNLAKRYSNNRLPNLINPKMMDRIEYHRSQNHQIFIVSGSIEDWLSDWCSQQNIGLISSRLETSNGKLTGRFQGKDCQGQEKVNRIKERINLSQVKYIYAYGNSRHDREMLDLANEAFWV